MEYASNGWAYPSGTVDNQADYDRLQDKLHVMFGDELAEAMLRGVEIDDEP